MGKPEGLKTHWPAWKTDGIGVLTEEAIFRRLFTTGTVFSNDQPVIAPSELPTLLKILMGVVEKRNRILSLIFG